MFELSHLKVEDFLTGLTQTCEVSWTVTGTVITMIVDKELEILEVTEEPWRFHHLQPFSHGRFLGHFN